MDTTRQLQLILSRLAEGDSTARDDLFRRAHERLRQLLGRALHRDFARLSAVEQTDDLLQDIHVRWLKSWDQLLADQQGQIIQDAGVFLSRVSRLIREVLLDSVRHHFGRSGNRPQVRPLDSGLNAHGSPRAEPGTETHEPAALARLTEIHEAIEALPERLRRVVDLHWYQGISHAEVAALLGLGESTVRKDWVKARLTLVDRFGENPLTDS